MADMTAPQSAARNLIVPAVALTVSASSVLDAYAMKTAAFPRVGLRDSGLVPEHLDQGAPYADDWTLGVVVEVQEDGTATKWRSVLRQITGAILAALDGVALTGMTGWRPALLMVIDVGPIQFSPNDKVLSQALTAQAFLQLAA